jgi:MFS family permease
MAVKKEGDAQKILDSLASANQDKVIEQTKENLEKERTMKLSVKEGALSTVTGSLGDAYITPYALSLNANNIHIGLLSSFVALLGPLAQLKGSKLMEKIPRKKLVVTGVILHAFMWLPILVLSFLFQKGILLNYLPAILIALYSIYAIAGSIATPAWFSMLGDIVPEKLRGKYFGKRNRIIGTVGFVATLLGAFLLDLFKTKGMILLGFSVLFFAAFLFRLFAAYLFTKHYDPKLKLEDGYYFTFRQFIQKAPKNNFGRFTIFVALIYFAMQVAGPFFAVYMWRDLGLGQVPVVYMLVSISSSVFALLSVGMWGKFSDKYGNKKLLQICGFVIPFFPVLWIFSASPVYLIFVPQLIAGIGWAGFNLATINFIYDAVTPQRRAICIAYFHLVVGIGIFLGGITGGLLASYVQISFMNTLLFIFLISGILRFIVVALFLPKVKEVKQVSRFKPNYILNLKQFHHVRGLIFEFFHHTVLSKAGKLKLFKRNRA